MCRVHPSLLPSIHPSPLPFSLLTYLPAVGRHVINRLDFGRLIHGYVSGEHLSLDDRRDGRRIIVELVILKGKKECFGVIEAARLPIKKGGGGKEMN